MRVVSHTSGCCGMNCSLFFNFVRGIGYSVEVMPHLGNDFIASCRKSMSVQAAVTLRQT